MVKQTPEGGLERDCNFLIEGPGGWKIEAWIFRSRRWVQKGEVVVKDPFERGDDAAERSGKLAGGDEHVDLEENLGRSRSQAKLSGRLVRFQN